MIEPVLVHDVVTQVADDLVPELADRGIEVRRAETEAESRELLADAEVAVVGRLPEELLAAAPGLQWVQAMSAGVDEFPLDAIEARGVALTNASGVHAEPAGEHVLAGMAAFERRLHRAVRQQARGEWERYEGGELFGKTLGVVGLGAIGGRAAELAAAVGMDVVGCKREPSAPPETAAVADTDDARDAVSAIYGPDELDAVLAPADYLAIACPLTDETRGLVGREELETLGPDGVLVNVARGAIVDQDALVAALADGTVRGAVLDAFVEEPLPGDSPLWELENVIVTPHVAGSTPRYGERLADLVAENLTAYRASGVEGLRNRVV